MTRSDGGPGTDGPYAEAVDRRSSDQYLDEEIVSGLVATQFPDLAGREVTELGAGWDHELFSVGGGWIFRFPRRAERVAWLTREIEINAVVAGALGPRVPVFERIGEPSSAYPYPFVGYRRLPGVGADQGRAADLDGLAADVGTLFAALHRIDPGRVPPTPDGWENEPWGELRAGLTSVAALARPLLGASLLALAEPYLSGDVREPPQDGPRRFIHNDICPDHLIVDRHTGRLNGLIDFTDAMAGDPVHDFVGLIGIGGYRFISRVAARYDLPLGGSFGTRLQWLSRVLTLTWLADAAAHDPASVPKHLSWVTHAFS
ncbi:MAG TPA: phosphotransferase [Streptosporangiaceae bacterium]|nr:phosphotransferase [Streptosporangiaceae bacterium]